MDLKSITLHRSMRSGEPWFFPAVEHMSFSLARKPIEAPCRKVAIVFHAAPPAVPLGVFALDAVLEVRIEDPTAGSRDEVVQRVAGALAESHPAGGPDHWTIEVIRRLREALEDPTPRLLVSEKTVKQRTYRMYWRPSSERAVLELDDGAASREVLEVRPPVPFWLRFPKGIRLAGQKASIEVRSGSQTIAVIEGPHS
jgi:hypothetical protein